MKNLLCLQNRPTTFLILHWEFSALHQLNSLWIKGRWTNKRESPLSWQQEDRSTQNAFPFQSCLTNAGVKDNDTEITFLLRWMRNWEQQGRKMQAQKIGVECIQSGKYKKEGIPINGMEADEANHPHHNYDNISWKTRHDSGLVLIS